MRKRIYIAGPITKGNVAENVARATHVGRELIRRGYAALVPQLSCFMGYSGSKVNAGYTHPHASAGDISHEDRLATDLPWVSVADAVLRLPGASKGADKETEYAEMLNIPVFYGDTDDEALAALYSHYELAPVGDKEPYHYAGVWFWFSLKLHLSQDDENQLPDDVYSRLQGGSEHDVCRAYQTRDQAFAAYEHATKALAAPVNNVAHSSHRTFETGSVRDMRTGKGRFDLLPPAALRRLAQHFERGAIKYSERNWEKGQPLQSYLDSALRHICNHQEGMRDEDHLIAAAWNLLAHVETDHRVKLGELPATLDDFPSHRLCGDCETGCVKCTCQGGVD